MSEATPALAPPAFAGAGSTADPPVSGRPRSQKRQRIYQRIGVYDDREAALFDERYQRYCQSAAGAAHGASVSAFVRYMTIGKGARRLPMRRIIPDLPPDLASMLSRVMMELMRQGNNLNQIAYHQNAGREVSPAYIQATFTEYRETIRAIQKLMGMEDERA